MCGACKARAQPAQPAQPCPAVQLSPYGQPNEQDPQYRVRGMDRASLGGTRQFDPRQFDPRQLGTRGGGTRYGGTSNNLAFAERQVYAQRQRDNDRRAELRRESDRRDRRDRYYDRPLESERYQGVVKPTARQVSCQSRRPSPPPLPPSRATPSSSRTRPLTTACGLTHRPSYSGGGGRAPTRA